MSSKPTPACGASAEPPSTMLTTVSVRGCTWLVATALCSSFWVGVGELVFG